MRPLLVGGSGLYFRAVVDDLEFPGEDPSVRAELEAEADGAGRRAAATCAWATLDPVAAAKIEPGNVRRIVRALEVAAITGTPFSSFAAGWERYDPVAGAWSAGIAIDARGPGRPHRAIASRAMFAAGWLDEVRGLVERGFGAWLTVQPGDRLRGARPPPRR